MSAVRRVTEILGRQVKQSLNRAARTLSDAAKSVTRRRNKTKDDRETTHDMDHFDGANNGPGNNGTEPSAPSRSDVDDYLAGRPQRDANYGSAEAQAFQQTHAGPTEFQIGEGADAVWADGVGYDPGSGGTAVEAKYVQNPGGSSVYEGTAPDFVSSNALAGFDSEMMRYGAVIADPSNPITHLDVVVSTDAARDFLAPRIESVLPDVSLWSIRVG